jgi:alpha-glucosidase
MKGKIRTYDPEIEGWRLKGKEQEIWILQCHDKGFCSLYRESPDKRAPVPSSYALVSGEQRQGRLDEMAPWQKALAEAFEEEESQEGLRVYDFAIGTRIYSGFSFEVEPQAMVMGLGDKPDLPDLRGRTYEHWGTDTYAFGRGSDPLYKNVPFFLVKGKEKSWGFFMNHTARAGFDFTKSTLAFGFCKDTLEAEPQYKDWTLYIFQDCDPLSIVKQYLSLTGLPELPPLWALGYHQSKWSYFPDKKVKKLAKRFRAEKIPCDALYLDIDYMEGFRCFTWDKSRFPHPRKLVSWLDKKGFKTVTMIDPGIKKDKKYQIWKQGQAEDVYCKYPDGKPFKGNVWPGACHFPDFTAAAVREWWAHLFEEMVGEIGVAGVWNDMNEPALYDPIKKVQTQRTFPLEVRHHFEGWGASHALAHNVYGMLMSRATQAGLRKFRPGKRPFVLTRSSFSGGQRYAAVWTGDNVASWEHLKIACWQIQSLNVSGFGFSGSDIGGFVGDGEGELMVRWMQLAVFHPFFRTHSSKGFADREPWSYGEPYTSAVRSAIELRYHLILYLYTAMRRHTREGEPLVSPLPFVFQDEPFAMYEFQEFMAGSDLLVAPILHPRTYGRKVYLPKGQWFDFYSGQRFIGGEEYYILAPLPHIPVFAKAGSFIPWSPLVQSTAEPYPEALRLVFFPGEGEGEVYRDAGEGYAHSDQMEYLLERYRAQRQGQGYRVEVKREGLWPLPFDYFYFEIRDCGATWEIKTQGGIPDPLAPGLWKLPLSVLQWEIHPSLSTKTILN